MAVNSERRNPSFTAADDHSGVEDHSLAQQYQDLLLSAYPGVTTGDHISGSESTAKIHYEELRYSLGNTSLWEPTNFRSDARAKLACFNRVQFLELVTDVHDEMARITGHKGGIRTMPSFLPPRDDFNRLRNEWRQRLASLRPDSLKNLMSDVFYELGRRCPQFKEVKRPCGLACTSWFNGGSSTPDAAAIRPPLARGSARPNIPDDRVAELLRAPLGPSCGSAGTISSSMSVTEIITALQQHGCPSVTDMLDVHRCDVTPVAGGGFGDVYRGYLRNGAEIAIKCPRLLTCRDEMNCVDLKMAARELHAWSKHQHPNVMPLLGVAQFRDGIAMVSPWMRNGTLLQYLIRFPNANRFDICHQISSGVTYLHSAGTVHGDIKGVNVLVSQKGIIKLIDFGNSRLNNSTLQFTGSQPASTFSTRWTAPELLIDGRPCSVEADVYALGMTMLEVFSGKIPFWEVGNDPAIITRVVVQKRHPERPFGSIPTSSQWGNTLWDLLTRCWFYDPLDRPSASRVQTQIEKITREWLLDAEIPRQALAEYSER